MAGIQFKFWVTKAASWRGAFVLLSSLTFASSSDALSLGRLSGVPVLGQPFNGSVAATIAPTERLESECVKADLYSGEDKINPNNVRVEVQGQGEARQIRIRSTQRLSEPLLTVYLEAGCDARISRRYTLFVDPVSAAMPSSDGGSQAEESLATARPAAEAVTASPRNVGTSDLSPSAARPRAPRASLSRARPEAVRTAKAVVPIAKNAKGTAASSAAGGSRLTVELAAPGAAAGTAFSSFQMSRDLSFPVDDAESARRKELRVLRDALMAEIEGKVQPGEFAKRVQDLEAANDKLLKEAANARAQVAAERAKRERIEQESFPSWLFYTVLGALGAVLAAGFFLWRRRGVEDEGHSVVDQVFSRHSELAGESQVSQLSVLPQEGHVTAVDIETPENETDSIKWYERFMPSRRKGLTPSDLPATMPMTEAKQRAMAQVDSAFFQSQSHAAEVDSTQLSNQKRPDTRAQDAQRRIVPSPLTPHEQMAVNEMADISQEAEFFMEIGENDRAISLLEGSLGPDHGLTPIPQLYLFDLYRKTGNQSAYEQLRSQFAERFNAHVPDWEEDPANFRRELADYPRALEQVCRGWRSDSIVSTLESLLVDDTRGSRLGFDLPAYREVIFLYGIAKQLEMDGDESGFELSLGASSLPTPQLVGSVPKPLPGADVDFELPMEGETQAQDTQVMTTPITASAPAKAAGASTSGQTITLDNSSIDFDLEFDEHKSAGPTKKP